MLESKYKLKVIGTRQTSQQIRFMEHIVVKPPMH